LGLHGASVIVIRFKNELIFFGLPYGKNFS
jgi:hypothetical protein